MILSNAYGARSRNMARRSGFTLMEMLVVVAIIVVLAGIGGYQLFARLEEAKVKAASAQMKEITKGVQTYFLNNGSYPPSLDALTQMQPNGGKPIMDADAIYDPWHNPYSYDQGGAHNSGSKPDIWTTNPQTGEMIGNWPGGSAK